MASTEAGNSSMSSLSDSDANPPSPVPKSNHLPDRLDFSHVDGGKKTTRRENKDMGKQQDTEKRKLHDGLEDGELSTDSEFEAPRKLQKTDKVEVLARAEMNSSPSTGLEDESSKTDIDTMETEGEGETTLVESQDFAEEFHIVDDAEMDDDDNLPESDDDDLDDNEIYAWLEEGIEKPVTTATKASTSDTQENEGEYTEKQKIILKEIGRNPFEVLPEGWVMVTHNCGMPFYLHKQSRVCTASKPYFLGSGSVRKHSIPVSAIPCLHYRREKEKIAKNLEPVQNSGEEPVQSAESLTNQSTEPVKNNESVQTNKSVQVQSSNSVPVTTNESEPVHADDRAPEPVQQNGGVEENVTQNGASTENLDQQPLNTRVPSDRTAPIPPSDKTAPLPPSDKIAPVPPPDKTAPVPPPEIKTVEHTEKEYSIEAEELHKYCEGLFDFKTITVKKFTSWKDKRRHLNKEKSQARPSLPSDIKVITCPIQPADKSKAEKNKRREFVLNPVGKTPLCILHEYVQHVLRVQPEYIFKELECAATPYSATVRINKIDYATGLGSSKKQAKLEGAKKTLEILIPHLQLDDESKPKKDDVFGDMKFFDEISVEDPRISDLSDKAGVNKPYQVLQECLKRNYGMGYRNSEITLNKTIISNQKSEFTITVGKHTASVVSKNKREGKQKAAQAMLQLLHPHIKSWGSILRLYSENTVKGLKEKDDEPVTQLQSKHSSLNAEILNKLKTAMMKLRETREQFTTKGTLRIAYRVPQSQVKNIDL